MRPTRAALLVLAAACACASPPDPAPSPPPAAPAPSTAIGPLAFGWKAGDEATVTLESEKKGQTATTRYVLQVEPSGDTLLMTYRDFTFLAVQGADMADPAVKAELDGLARKVSAQLPPFRVSRTGAWIGFDDLDAVMKAAEAFLEPDQVEAFRKVMAAPQTRQMIARRLQREWGAWVSTWIGVEARVGDVFEKTTQTPIGGTLVPTPTKLEVKAAEPGQVRLVLTSELKGKTASEALMQVMMQMSASVLEDPAKRKEAEAAFAQMSMTRTSVIDATVEVETLRPRTVHQRSETRVTSPEATQTRVEDERWTFEWK